MNCDYCRQPFDEFSKTAVNTPCKHQICNECAMFIEKKNEGCCPEHENKINPNSVADLTICQEHKIKFMHFCYDHMIKVCSKCTDHKNCKGRFPYNSNNIEEKLTNVYEDKRNEIKSIVNLNQDSTLIQGFLEVQERGIAEFECILSDLLEARNSQRKEIKQKTLETHNKITAALLSKEDEDASLYEKIINLEEEIVIPDDNELIAPDSDFEENNGINPGEDIQVSKEIEELYKKLGNGIIRLFLNLKTAKMEDGCSCLFYFTQDLVDRVSISGVGIGKSVGSEFSYIIDFEIFHQDLSVVKIEESFQIHEDNGIVYDVRFDAFELERNESCCVRIHVEGPILYIFNVSNQGPVSVIDSNFNILETGCPILYFILDQPLMPAQQPNK